MVSVCASPCLKRFSRCLVPPEFKCLAVRAPSQAKDTVRFVDAAKKANLVPLYRCIFSDQLTPVLAYRCLVKEDDIEAPSFLFDSFCHDFQSSNPERYSVVGHQPAMEIVVRENWVTIMDHREGWRKEEFSLDPILFPQTIMQGWAPQAIDDLPDAFCGFVS